MANIPRICDAIILYEGLQKRKVYLDAFSDGLEVFRMRTAIHLFPHLFKDLFIPSDTCSSDDVLAVLKFRTDLTTEEQRVTEYLLKFIRHIEEKGMQFNIVNH